MVGKSKAFSNEVVEQCQACLKKLGKHGEQAKRLQAIISAQAHGVTKVASVFNITRKTLTSWLYAFKKSSVAGLRVQPGRGRKRIFSFGDEEKIRRILEENPGITIDHLQAKIIQELKIRAGRTSVYRLIRKLDMAYITPRPRHYKSDKLAQENFKKKSRKDRPN